MVWVLNKQIAVLGANHRSSGAALRDRLFVTEAMLPEVTERLRSVGIENFTLMSTCDRVELQVATPTPDNAFAAIRALFSDLASLPMADIEAATYALADDEAVRHIFAVAASLDSQMVGEPQVLGQFKAAYREAERAGRLDGQLTRTLQHAFRVAKRVRGETEIAKGVVSIASAAVTAARNLHGDLADRHTLVFGLGDMGELICSQLAAAGLKSIALAARPRRSETVARSRGYGFEPMKSLPAALARADILILAAGSGRIEIEPQQLSDALRERRRRPILVVDTGVPAEVDRRAEELDDIYLYGLEDLEQVALQGRSRREELSDEAWRIIDDEVVLWRQDTGVREAAPLVSGLKSHFEEVRADVLAEMPGISAEEATRRLINRLLHGPMETMRQDLTSRAEDRDKALQEIEQAVAKLFYRSGPTETDQEEE
ncbi:MAG TPA: glutamyl-tRNA reductase [Rhodospirillaceae bacterium]|nr:glutamyl-tRNA reductase [Rhodospirillaceae bacterium]HAT35828.1 glutamyl-tRNA reductase [Rhodospirillaceae bacterium]